MKNSHLAKIFGEIYRFFLDIRIGQGSQNKYVGMGRPPLLMFEIVHTFSFFSKKDCVKTKLFLQANATRGVIAALVVVAIFLGYALLDR